MTQQILLLCTHHSARSPMAQGLLNWLTPERYTAAARHSACSSLPAQQAKHREVK